MKKVMIVLGVVVILVSSMTVVYGQVERSENGSSRLWESRKKRGPASKVAFSRGVFQIGDFFVALSSVERKASTANLNFVITKTKEASFEVEPIVITLTDDHANSYRGRLEITPPIPFLPVDFTYVKTASIAMPKAAPIETIQIEDVEQIEFKKIKLVKPKFKSDFGTAFLRLGEPTSLGRFLSFTVEEITHDLFTWIISITVENKDYNELKGMIQCAFQDTDGEIISTGGFQSVVVSGLSRKTTSLAFEPSHKTPHLRVLLIFYHDLTSGQTILKFWPIDSQKFRQDIIQGLSILRLQMVDQLQKNWDIKDQQVLAAMRKVPRHEFASCEQWEGVYKSMSSMYTDRSGGGRIVFQPYLVAYMIQALRLKAEEKVLLVDTGSGYTATILSEITDPDRVFRVETYGVELAQYVRQALERLGYGKIKVKIRDGYLGWKEHAPFDAILVTAASSQISQSLVDQLGEGGRMIVPVGGTYLQRLILVEKHMGKSIQKTLPFPPVSFRR